MRNRMQPLGDRHPIRLTVPEKLLITADRDRIEQVSRIYCPTRFAIPGCGPSTSAPRSWAIERTSTSGTRAWDSQGAPAARVRTFRRAHGSAFGGLGLGLAISKASSSDTEGGSGSSPAEDRRGQRFPRRAAVADLAACDVTKVCIYDCRHVVYFPSHGPDRVRVVPFQCTRCGRSRIWSMSRR